jgi:hypothetical protein
MAGEVKSMRIIVAVLCGSIFVAACGSPIGGRGQAAGDYKLYEAGATASSQFVSIVDSHSHSTERRLPLGTPSGDWRHLYSIRGLELVDTDPTTGATLRTIPLPGDYMLPPANLIGMPGGLSQNGRFLVLESWEGGGASPPAATHLLVVDTTLFGSAPVRVDLNGWYQFDAVSNDGDRVYLIEYVSGTDYRVRIYQVAAQQLDPTVVVDKFDPKESMTGTRLGGVASPDGAWLYSVYVRQTSNPFVHALTLSGAPIAFCIDLPGSGYSTNPSEMHWSLVLSADESRLFAVNAALGLASEIDATRQSVTRTVHFAASSTNASRSLIPAVEAKELGGSGAVLSPDGKVLVAAGTTGIVWIDTSSLNVNRRGLNDWHVQSLGLSPDGKTLYALKDSGMVAEISMASGSVDSTFDPADGYPIAFMRVAAA